MHVSILALVSAAFAGLTSAYTTPVGASPSGNPFSKPALNEIVPVGSPYKITWNPTTPGTVTLVLLRGPAANLVPLFPIVEKIANTGTYTWTPPATLEPDTTRYGIQLIVDATGAYQYTAQFGIANPSYKPASSSASMASMAASTMSASVSRAVVSQIFDGQIQAATAAATSAKASSAAAASAASSAPSTATSAKASSTAAAAAATSVPKPANGTSVAPVPAVSSVRAANSTVTLVTTSRTVSATVQTSAVGSNTTAATTPVTSPRTAGAARLVGDLAALLVATSALFFVLL